MNCNDLPGRLKSICDGTAVKKNGEPFTEIERQAIVQRRTSSADSESSDTGSSVVLKKRGCDCGKKK
jgi:hypothetical protein